MIKNIFYKLKDNKINYNLKSRKYQFWYQFWYQIWYQVGDQIGYQIVDQIVDQIWTNLINYFK